MVTCQHRCQPLYAHHGPCLHPRPAVVARKVPDSHWRPDDPPSAPKTPGVGLWAELGACRDAPGVDFYPEPKSRKGAKEAERAKAVCAGCPVRQACRRGGMDERFGIWGGLTETERGRLRNARRPHAA